jgi:sugar/nucleoside kinase (ribokinase family)/nucleoside 2-deoxyribosyltransferase
LGGAAYAARAAAATGVRVVLGGPLHGDVPDGERERLERMGIVVARSAGGASGRYVMLGTGAAESRFTVPINGEDEVALMEEQADAYVLLAREGFDLEQALLVARRNARLVVLDGHSTEMRDPRWRQVLRDVDVLFLNLNDARALAGGDAIGVARALDRLDRITVIKHGRGGLTAFASARRIEIGACEVVFGDKVGAGDTLIGAALARYLLGDDLEEALTYGAAAAAHHIEAGTVPDPGYVADVRTRPRVYVPPERYDGVIYVAAPFFTSPELRAMERVVGGLEAAGLRVASPSRDIGILRADATHAETAETFRRDVEALEGAAALVALLDQDDPGTAWEVGYAYKRGIPIVGMRTDVRAAQNNMLTHSVTIVRDMDQVLRELFRALAR